MEISDLFPNSCNNLLYLSCHAPIASQFLFILENLSQHLVRRISRIQPKRDHRVRCAHRHRVTNSSINCKKPPLDENLLHDRTSACMDNHANHKYWKLKPIKRVSLHIYSHMTVTSGQVRTKLRCLCSVEVAEVTRISQPACSITVISVGTISCNIR